MIKEYLEKIVREEKLKNSSPLYIRSSLKEYLQVLVLEYIYTSADYKSKFIFTGGTCLRHVFGLERLSEDLDFDALGDVDVESLVEDLGKYFKEKLFYKDIKISIKQQGRQVLLKFPVLQKLGLATKSESDLLYIKMDIAEVVGSSFETEKTSKNVFGSNFVILHYDLPSLFAGKITAILTRNLFEGRENREILKGRDFFDLLWYLKKDIKPNLVLLQERLGEKITEVELKKRLFEKVRLATTKFKQDFKNDLAPFIVSSSFVEDYVENFSEEFERKFGEVF